MSAVARAAGHRVKQAWNAVEKEGGHALRFINSANGADQVIKLLGAWAELVTALAKHFEANEDATYVLGEFTSWVKNARIVSGLLNAPRKIKSVKGNVLNISRLVQGIISGKDVTLKRKSDYWCDFQARSHTFEGTVDKIIGITYELSSGTANVAFMFAFGVCRPILVVMKFYDDVPAPVAKVGKAFGVVMLIQGGCTLVACFSDIGHEVLVYVRSEGEDPGEDYKQLKNAFKRHSIKIVQKSCKVVQGAFALSSSSLPPVASASLGAFTATIGFVDAYINTQ